MNEGEITISRLRIPVFIGVPDEERQASQDIEISLSIVPETTLFGTNDKIDKTVDYYEISQRLTTVAQSHPRKLIEQLNEDLLKMVMEEFPVKAATITTYKFIINNTDHVSISMSRNK